MDRLWQNVKDATRSVTVVKTLKTLVALIVIVLITGAYGTLKAHQTNKIELTKTRLVNQMADKVKNTGVNKESGFLYYLDKNGHVSRTKMARGATKGGSAEVVANAGVQRESGWLYFIDKDGDVARTKMARGRK